MKLDTILNMDCLEGMKLIPDHSVDCIICDLPYGVLHRNNPNAQWDRIIPFKPLWEQYLRVTKDNAAILLFGQGMFTAKLMMSQPKLWRYNLVWDKMRVTGFLNANRMPLRCHEDIVVFYRKLPIYHPQMEIGPASHPQGNGHHKLTNSCYGNHTGRGNEPKVIDLSAVPSVSAASNPAPSHSDAIDLDQQSASHFGNDHIGRIYDRVKRVAPTNKLGEKFPRSIIPIRKEHESKVLHATQKPVELIRYLIRTYTNLGG